VAVTWISVLACAGSHEPGAAATPPTAGASAAGESIDPAGIVGTWVSPACGERAWVRTLVLEAGGSYHGSDPISPCPPGARCIWSGIVDFRGTWVIADRVRLELTETPEQRPPMAQVSVRPPSLTLRGGVLFDDLGCRYERSDG
jgi:hypothetical protein